ncbi:sensor domain-containing diguanylate cyclase [Aurantiacibacter rhizosphaerae]|uniref:diguanylate cyclase n=1 Tax=Aurantiacibacter rhizosphaerae TaxID=2691582 RepID=A0A844XGU6_9SPHN|nr:GGDEF domain-containing protein [Aurantiacibacter rhizosphaerae]MWV28872.1 diguanylate cyclase [Aurantiacibacter rhizosphaerae]
MTVSAIFAMTALVAGLCVFCAVICASLQRHAALIWMGVALLFGIIESLALKDNSITQLDLWVTTATVVLSYVCVGESVRIAYGQRRSSRTFFAICGAAILTSLALLQLPVPHVLQFLPSQLAGAAAMMRAVIAVQRAGRRGDQIDTALICALTLVSAIYILRIPVFPVLVGRDVPFADFSRQDLQDILVFLFAILVPAVVLLTITRLVTDSLHLYRMRAEHDFLTNLPNRRAFETMANQPDRGSGSLVICDIDNFKRINDQYGHAAGDAVIRAVASLLDCMGQPARIGGEEFAIWLPGADVEMARRHAEQLRRELMTLRLVELTDDHVITASFGIAAYGRFTPLRVALQTADMALYLAKNSGRNRVCVDGDPSAGREAARQAERERERARAAA